MQASRSEQPARRFAKDGQLEQLHLHPTDRQLAQSLEQPLKDDADAADRLAK